MDNTTFHEKDDICIVLCGAAGQGIQTVEKFATHILKRAGYHVFATKEYMSRIRGGSNSTHIRISSKRVHAYVERIDILIPLDKEAIVHVKDRISPHTIIVGEKKKLGTSYPIIDVPFSTIAKEIGGLIYANFIAIGILTGIFDVPSEMIEEYVARYFAKKSGDIIEKNIIAVKKGRQISADLIREHAISVNLMKDHTIQDELLLNGAEAVGIGALAGGCNFIASYPMSPSTGVLVFLAQHAKDFNLITEQAEDEISAINMALGAWFAGARALVTTSGGGFALMQEGVSLAGILETPVVIHLAQRPGPATGLPTRTEQADLQFALYSGHGEFPRIIFAPGTIEDAIRLTQKAFNYADKYQIPVFILTDQFFMDSYYNLPPDDIPITNVTHYFSETTGDYKRYRITENGVSPRGIPGYGSGVVIVDSDEHDEEGHLTEDLALRSHMVEKRLRKLSSMTQEAVPPELIGEEEYTILIICWGSTYGMVKEAVKRIGRNDISVLHFTQVYPLWEKTSSYIQKAQRIIIIEGNATSQFGKLLKLTFGIEAHDKILKYNGLPFSVEEIMERLKGLGIE